MIPKHLLTQTTNPMKKNFNTKDWLASPKVEVQPITMKKVIEVTNSSNDEIEKIIQSIEDKQIDITTSYEDWRNIGFIFADEFGESGRDYFHRISKFYLDYNSKDCDQQFDQCLKSKGSGLTIKTFFFKVQSAGVSISNSELEEEENEVKLPCLNDEIFEHLPEFFKKVVIHSSTNEERDIMLLSAITVISSCLHKVSGIYDGKRVFPNLYLYITAQASAGKGKIGHCKQIVKPIHKHLREETKKLKMMYDAEMMEYNSRKGADKGEKPQKPAEKMLFIPANNSSTGMFQLLAESNGRGLIFETEGDTIALAFKSEYGNYSDGFRKAYHHETISYYRRTDREYVDIENPCISTVLSGTPKQISSLIPNAENGLFSRFMFYYMKIDPVWNVNFSFNLENGLDDYFDELGVEFYELYKLLLNNSDIRFNLTLDQQNQFNNFFRDIQNTYITLQGLEYIATVRRLGLVAYRIAMIFTSLRILEHGDVSNSILCEDEDFNNAISIVKILIKHASSVFSQLPEDSKTPKFKNLKEQFLENLPANFSCKQYLEVADKLKIPHKTAEGYITTFIKSGLIQRLKKDSYQKPNP